MTQKHVFKMIMCRYDFRHNTYPKYYMSILYIGQHKAKCRKNVVNFKYYTYPNYNVLILYLVQHRAKCRKKVVSFKHNTYP